MEKEKGHFRCYVDKRFNPDALATIQKANKIIDEYQGKGFSLTLRQLYYQFVARGMLENSDRNYDRLGVIISEARLAGLVSWTAIEDRTRYLRGINTLATPADAVKAARSSYAKDLWRDQNFRPEVWIEKDALVGVIGNICNELRVDFFACRGYNSQSEQWRAGQRFANYIQKGQRPIVFHLGDHDPSGIDMTRDNQDRLSMFAGTRVMVVRLALNYNQVEQYKPPPNPAKVTDPRAAGYMALYGVSSWELDALDPTVIEALIRDAVVKVRNEEQWNRDLAGEADDKDTLDLIVEQLGGSAGGEDESI